MAPEYGTAGPGDRQRENPTSSRCRSDFPRHTDALPVLSTTWVHALGTVPTAGRSLLSLAHLCSFIAMAAREWHKAVSSDLFSSPMFFCALVRS